ncbi:hypothetical protein GOP47_0026688 [Adiantum capillus-veneris]|nr:hypothetical protein GOP47_0026688 [Adiantum capillus-veneris]
MWVLELLLRFRSPKMMEIHGMKLSMSLSILPLCLHWQKAGCQLRDDGTWRMELSLYTADGHIKSFQPSLGSLPSSAKPFENAGSRTITDLVCKTARE